MTAAGATALVPPLVALMASVARRSYGPSSGTERVKTADRHGPCAHASLSRLRVPTLALPPTDTVGGDIMTLPPSAPTSAHVVTAPNAHFASERGHSPVTAPVAAPAVQDPPANSELQYPHPALLVHATHGVAAISCVAHAAAQSAFWPDCQASHAPDGGPSAVAPASDTHTPMRSAFAHHPHPGNSEHSAHELRVLHWSVVTQLLLLHVLCGKPPTAATSLAPQNPLVPPVVHHEHLEAAAAHARQEGRQPQSRSRPHASTRCFDVDPAMAFDRATRWTKACDPSGSVWAAKVSHAPAGGPPHPATCGQFPGRAMSLRLARVCPQYPHSDDTWNASLSVSGKPTVLLSSMSAVRNSPTSSTCTYGQVFGTRME
mmetsp:Transcript_27175/g.67983  ORF Transcript_27175/g.67983 Transcript_27175/m.67983 type:complete len:374 (+) Transcript_27175:2489-3610(+)